MVEPGAFYIMDRGYLDFSRLHTLHQAGAYFVIRARKDLRFVRYVSQPIDPDTGLCSDHIGRLRGFYSRKAFPDKLRMVRFYDSVQDRRFCFLSNHLLLPALTICQLYKMRWEVELFFKWDQAASANQAFLRKLDQRSQNSGLDRGVRLRAGGDLEERTATAAKFTQHFTSFKCQRI